MSDKTPITTLPMANSPASPTPDITGAAAAPPISAGNDPVDLSWATADQLVVLLQDPSLRESVLSQLCKVRETCKDLPLILWNSFNTVYILLQEIIAVYKVLSPSKFTSKQFSRVYNALALLQCMAACPETRMDMVKAKLPVYLYPFLKAEGNEKPLQHLRLMSLGVIGALAKFDGPDGQETLYFLLETELFPLCLRCMEIGNELTQTVSTMIVKKILTEDEGLKYCCASAERFYSVLQVLTGMVQNFSERPSLRLLKYAVSCYLRLSEVPRLARTREAYRNCLPTKLADNTFVSMFAEDPHLPMMLEKLFYNLM